MRGGNVDVAKHIHRKVAFLSAGTFIDSEYLFTESQLSLG